jgi:coproporphyrinogen III oxidase
MSMTQKDGVPTSSMTDEMQVQDELERPQQVRAYLLGLQKKICTYLESFDGEARFCSESYPEASGALAQPRVMTGGAHIEQAAANFTHSVGDQMPSAATAARPQLTGRGFQAVSFSWIIHPRNPYAPTCHGNLRFFTTTGGDGSATWWFGGGWDLTPYYPNEGAAQHWHQISHDACIASGGGDALYRLLKRQCDEYFFLPHRQEPRGIGGLLFDDWCEQSFEKSFALIRAIGDRFLTAYQPILERGSDREYGKRERDWQLYRRGRYVEFNLLYDRGTKYGLQSGRRIESVLASIPPAVRFEYQHTPIPNSPEAKLLAFLAPRDWIVSESRND